jgi:hypothetical protein
MKIKPENKKILQGYAREIYQNILALHPEAAAGAFNAKACTIIDIMMYFDPSNANHERYKKYFPRKYNLALINNGNGNCYDSVFFSMTDDQRWTIVRKGISGI